MEDKTMKKVFGIAALLLALAACNKVETKITPVEQPSDSKGITITATLAPKTADAKAVTDNGDNKITVTWAENEHIAILYDKDGAQVADATITAVDGTTGAATISFTVVSGTADNTACTLVYPYSAAKDDKSGVKDAATLLSAQDGMLNANLDVRVGDGTIQTTTPSLDVTTQPEAQFAIFKFTVKNADASATIDVKSLTITIGTQDYVITPASATSSLYAALPAVSGQTVSFSATGSDSKTYTCSKDNVTFAASKYYQSTLKMASAVPKIPYLINIPDFSDSFVYKVMIGENKQIAEICNEYLYKSGEFVDEEGTVALDHKAIVAYPMRDNGEGQMVADHSNGFVLQLMKETVDGKTVSYAVDDAPIHGGKVVFDSKGMLEYIPGNSAPVDKFYYIDKAFSTDSFDECQTASIEAEVISDDPSRYDQGVSNVYRITKIGSQYWTVDNLRASKYNDGESIRYFAPDETEEWPGASTNRLGKYTWYKDTGIDVSSDAAYKNVYGALYNWTAICKGGGKDVTFPYNVEDDYLAPAGWKVPFRADYKVLYSYLGENKSRMIRVMMKADMAADGEQPDRASAQWAYDEEKTFTNITNFSAINSGYCNSSKIYFSDTFYMYFATSGALTRAYGFKLPFDIGTDDKYVANHWYALSIRCIKAD